MTPQRLRDRLLEHHHPPLICGPDSHLVIEGYPRSSNSFAVWMLFVLQGDGFGEGLGHHTHSVDNLRLAEHFGVPSAVLIRAPEDAILSLTIFADAPIDYATDRYLGFYEGTLALEKMPLVLPFDMVTHDYNQVVDRLNAHAGQSIRHSTDLEGDTARAYAMARERADEIHGDKVVEQIAIPSAEREAIKATRRAEVQAHLAGRPEVQKIYDAVMARV